MLRIACLGLEACYRLVFVQQCHNPSLCYLAQVRLHHLLWGWDGGGRNKGSIGPGMGSAMATHTTFKSPSIARQPYVRLLEFVQAASSSSSLALSWHLGGGGVHTGLSQYIAVGATGLHVSLLIRFHSWGQVAIILASLEVNCWFFFHVIEACFILCCPCTSDIAGVYLRSPIGVAGAFPQSEEKYLLLPSGDHQHLLNCIVCSRDCVALLHHSSLGFGC